MITELALIVVAILLDPFVAISLATTILIVGSFTFTMRWLMPVAFTLGLIMDITSHRWLGIGALEMMTAGLIIFLVKEQFDLRQGWVVALFGVLAEAIYRLGFGQPVIWPALLGQGIMSFTGWWLIRHTAKKGGVYLRG